MKGKQYIEISESHTNFFQNVGISVFFWVTLPESSGPLKTVFQKLSADANPTGHSRRIFGYHQSLLILNRSQAILIRGVFFVQHEFPIATPTFSKHKIFHFSFLDSSGVFRALENSLQEAPRLSRGELAPPPVPKCLSASPGAA